MLAALAFIGLACNLAFGVRPHPQYCRMTIRCLLATFIVLCVAHAAPTQQSPRFSGSLLLGPERTGGGEFRDNAGVASEIAGTARLAVIRDVAFITTVAYGGVGGTGDVTSICILSPR